MTANGYINPIILVGVSSDNRQYEFTPKAETEQGIKYFLKSGGANLLALHFKDENTSLYLKKISLLFLQYWHWTLFRGNISHLLLIKLSENI